MDERELHDRLKDAADEVTASSGLASRAERRYLRRRARVRVVSGAVVVVLIGSGIATAAMIAGNRKSTNPAPDLTHLRPPTGPVDVKAFSSLAFVSAVTGYGVTTVGTNNAVLVETQDGARTWRAVASMPPATTSVAVAPTTVRGPAPLVAWGTRDVWATRDAGRHWEVVLRNAGNVVASPKRVWATARCGSGEPCNNKLMTSSNGSTWTSTDVRQPYYIGSVAVAPISVDVAFVAALGDRHSTRWEIDGTSADMRVTHLPTPCPASAVPLLAVGGNNFSLMLVCKFDARDRVFVSHDRGREWEETVALPAAGRVAVVSALDDDAGTMFMVGMGTAVGPGWSKGPLKYPVLDQWEWSARPQPIGDVRAIAVAQGAFLYFAASTGVYFDHGTVRELRTDAAAPPPTAARANPREIGATSFVTSGVGFGLRGALGEPLEGELVRTDNGGRTWLHAGELRQGQIYLHFVNATNGVAYGNGPLQFTTDGGAHWTETSDGPFHANTLSWSGSSLWSFIACDVSSPCDTLQVSNDAGRTWRTTAPLRGVLNLPSVLVVDPSTAYVAGGNRAGASQMAVTRDGGRTWEYRPTPCGPLDAHLATNGSTMLLLCSGGRTATQEFDAYTSGDKGQTWSAAGHDPFVGGYFGELTTVGTTFVAGMRRGEIWSSTDGKSWQQDTNVGEGFWSIDAVPGAGAWATNGDSAESPNSGMWFSADGVHWQQRAGG